MTSQPTPPAAISVADTQRHLSICRTTIFALIRSGDLASFRVGRKRLILTESIEDFIAERCGAEYRPHVHEKMKGLKTKWDGRPSPPRQLDDAEGGKEPVPLDDTPKPLPQANAPNVIAIGEYRQSSQLSMDDRWPPKT